VVVITTVAAAATGPLLISQPLVQKSSARWRSLSYLNLSYLILTNLILSYLKMALMYKKLPMGGAVYMSQYEVNSRRQYP